jgi:hypothetical protein
MVKLLKKHAGWRGEQFALHFRFYYYYNFIIIIILLKLYFNTELFHNIKLTKNIQREDKMSDLPNDYFNFVTIKTYFWKIG